MNSRISNRSSTQPATGQAGFALLEILIAMVVIALWLLAHAGLQMNALKFQSSSQSRLTALSLASDLGERMEANKSAARAGGYAYSAAESASAVDRDCTTASCSPSLLAEYDLQQWSARAKGALPSASLAVNKVSVAGEETTYTISIAWSESAGSRYASASSATAPSNEVLSLVTTKVIHE